MKFDLRPATLEQSAQGPQDALLVLWPQDAKDKGALAQWVEAAQRQEMQGQPVILLVAGQIRAMMSRFARMAVPNIYVLAYQEIPDNKQVTIVATVGQN